MRQGQFEEEIFIRTDSESVIALLSDFSQQHNIHPLIEKVERVHSPLDDVSRYVITSKIKWGPFHFKVKYRADILLVTENQIHTQAFPSFKVFIDNLTTVTPASGGVMLQETIILKAPILVFSYTYRQARAAHQEMFKRIKTYLERTEC